jgi:hypothetical protein
MNKDTDLKDNTEIPKVLVFSHNCFSKSGSNGRTLGNFFTGWPKEALAQFYIFNEIPDSPVCDNYFRVTDTEALKAFYKGIRVGRNINREAVIENDEDVLLKNLYNKHRKKTSLNYLVRNVIWDSNRWRSKVFIDWVDEFNPDVILLQVGDYEFMFKIALRVAKERNIPVLLYNSEDYYFKDRKLRSPMYHLYRSRYKRQFEKLMDYVSHTVYICDLLQETYNERFHHKSTVIMTSTNMVPMQYMKENDPLVVCYLGNLGLGRHEPLIEIANSLQQIDSNLYLNVYGNIPDEVVESALRDCGGIRYMGLVSYEEVIHVMQESDLLIHGENSSEFSQWDLKHAFSTKIADSLASGTCFFVYAPGNMACTKYLKENKVACVVTNKDELKESLRNVMTDRELRQAYIDTALQVVTRRHNMNINAKGMKDIIYSMAKKERTT